MSGKPTTPRRTSRRCGIFCITGSLSLTAPCTPSGFPTAVSYETAVGNPDGVQGAVKLRLPVMQKIPQRREVRRGVVGLPDINLQQGRMIRKAVVNCRGGQPIACDLQSKIPTHHDLQAP